MSRQDPECKKEALFDSKLVLKHVVDDDHKKRKTAGPATSKSVMAGFVSKAKEQGKADAAKPSPPVHFVKPPQKCQGCFKGTNVATEDLDIFIHYVLGAQPHVGKVVPKDGILHAPQRPTGAVQWRRSGAHRCSGCHDVQSDANNTVQMSVRSASIGIRRALPAPDSPSLTLCFLW